MQLASVWWMQYCEKENFTIFPTFFHFTSRGGELEVIGNSRKKRFAGDASPPKLGWIVFGERKKICMLKRCKKSLQTIFVRFFKILYS
jgi:hypothetical protein